MEEVVVRKQAELSVMEVASAGLDIVRSHLGKYIKMGIVPVLLLTMCFLSFSLGVLSGYLIVVGFLLLFVGGWYYVRFRVRCYRHMLLDEEPGKFDPKAERVMIWDFIGNSVIILVYCGLISGLLAFVPLALGYGLHEQLGPEGKRVLAGIFNTKVLSTLVPLLGMAFLADKVMLVFADVAAGGPATYARLEKFAKHARWKIILIMSIIWGTSVILDCAWAIAVAFKVNFPDGIVYANWIVGILIGYATVLWSMGAEVVLYKRLVMDVEAAETTAHESGNQTELPVGPEAVSPAG